MAEKAALWKTFALDLHAVFGEAHRLVENSGAVYECVMNSERLGAWSDPAQLEEWKTN